MAARGLGLLPGGDLVAVVGSEVLRYSATGDLLATLATDLDQPTELLVLSSGHLAVKAAAGVVLVSEAGEQVQGLASLSGGCRGIAEDARGRLLAIDTLPSSPHPFVLYVDVTKDALEAKLDLDIEDMFLEGEWGQAELTKLTYSGGKLFMVDRGNSRLTVFYTNQEGEDSATIVGEEGEVVGVPSFRAPGGLVVDREGSCLVADTGNNRLVLVHPMDQQEEYTVAEAVQVSPATPYFEGNFCLASSRHLSNHFSGGCGAGRPQGPGHGPGQGRALGGRRLLPHLLHPPARCCRLMGKSVNISMPSQQNLDTDGLLKAGCHRVLEHAMGTGFRGTKHVERLKYGDLIIIYLDLLFFKEA